MDILLLSMMYAHTFTKWVTVQILRKITLISGSFEMVLLVAELKSLWSFPKLLNYFENRIFEFGLRLGM